MDWGTLIATTIAAFITLAIFSFLYKDNPFYKFAEHMAVGLSAGYWVLILFHNVAIPNVYQRLMDGQWWYIFPTILGALMWTRFSRKASWISRYPLAFYIGIATGVAIPLEMRAKVIEQLNGTVGLIEYWRSPGALFLTSFNNTLILVGVVAGLVYFFFSKEHKGVTGVTAKFGIGVLMIGFGAAFGFTVMARISLLIQRVQFLFFDWLHWY
ncbi:MAG TPA: hypothetical protein VM118_01895 [Acidobacteriota bacterium]|nr:hypothetical protein [Acidobacteriota bacterium]